MIGKGQFLRSQLLQADDSGMRYEISSNVFSILLDFKGSFLNEMERLVIAREIEKKVLKAFLT